MLQFTIMQVVVHWIVSVCNRFGLWNIGACIGKLISVLLNSKEQFQTFIFQIEKDRVSKQCETLQPSPAQSNKIILVLLEWNKFESYWWALDNFQSL